jgi:pimeloyl-ACP methyl ester carboxylesterase
MIRRRHVFYLAGYDPLGFHHYHRMFSRETTRTKKIWPIDAAISDPVMDSDGKAGHWRIDSRGPNWQVQTTYEYLRWDDLITQHMARPMPSLMIRTALCLLEYLFNGTTFRIFRANWRFGIFYMIWPIALLALIALPLALLWIMATILPSPWGWVIGATGAVLVYLAGLGYARRHFVIQMCACWIWFRDRAHRQAPECDARYEEFARRIIAKARANDVDEILVVGHSGGGTIGVPIMARALEIDPDFARAGAPITLLVLGSSLPMSAMHPKADHAREAIRRVAVETSFSWIDAQARKDAINFFNFDMVRGVGVDPGPNAPNPVYWPIRYRDALAPEFYNRLRWNMFRMHFQFIMANDRRAPYDYIMLVCGPPRAIDWVQSHAWQHFDEVAAYNEPDMAHATKI